MRCMKKLISVLLSTVLAFSPGLAHAWGDEISYGSAEYQSDGITVNYICRGISSYEDGQGIIVTAVEGADETILQVVGIEEEKVLHVFSPGVTGTMWYGCAAEDGTVYCCIGRNLVIYNPATKTAKNAGYAPTTWSGNSNGIIAASDGAVYGVTSNYGNVYQYKDEKISTLYSVPNVNAMGGIAEVDGAIYFGGAYTGTDGAGTSVCRMNLSDRSVSTISNPLSENIRAVGQMYACGDYLIVQLTGYSGTKHAYFYHPKTNTWLSGKTIDFQANGMTDECGGKLFYLNGGKYYGIDTKTLEITSYPKLGGSYQRGNGLPIRYSGFLGECFVNVQYNGNLYVLSPEEQKEKHLNVSLAEAKMHRRISKTGQDGRVYVTGFMGSSGIAYDPETGEKEPFYMAQGEGAVSTADKMYIGCYTGAEIYELDMSKPYSTAKNGGNPKLIFDIGQDQDRPFGMDVAGNKLLVGTLPKAGTLGGALSVIDLTTKNGTTYRNLVQDQAILTVTHQDNTVFCGTTVCGGSASTPTTTTAHVFSFNLKNRKIIRDVEISIPGVDIPIGAVHGLKISPYDGKLYGSAAGVDFVMNPDTLEIERYHLTGEGFEEGKKVSSLQLWHEYAMEFYNGYLFRTNQILDPETLEALATAPLDGQFAGIIDGAAYFVTANTDIYKIPIEENKILGKRWTFDSGAALPEDFTKKNKDVPRVERTGASGNADDKAFGFLIGIGNGYGSTELTCYTNGYDILKEEIGENYWNDTTICMNVDFQVQNIDLHAHLLCPTFGAPTKSGFYGGLNGEQYAAPVSIREGTVYAGGQAIGSYQANEWHNVGAVYRVSPEQGVSFDVWYDGKRVAENLTVTSDVAKLGISCFSIPAGANSPKDGAPRFDTRGEYLYLDNLYIGHNTDNVTGDASYTREQDGTLRLNGGAYGGKVQLIFPDYENGRLSSVSSAFWELNPRETSNISFPEDFSCLVWKNYQTMQPVNKR